MTDLLPLSPDELLTTTRAVRKRLDLSRPVERQVVEVLGVAHGEYTQIGMFPVTYTIGTDFKPATRVDPTSVTRWNSW